MQLQRSNSIVNIRNVFRQKNKPLTLADIKAELPELKSSTISMALCYFLKSRYVIREKITNTNPKHIRNVWLYSYSESKFKKENNAGQSNGD
jgi:hypothetical protein